jgi:fructokinase
VDHAAIVFGEVVVDVYPDDEVPAGAALHVAAHLAAAGWTSFLVTRVGTDAAGDAFMHLFERHGIDTRHVERDPRLPSGRTTLKPMGLETEFTVHGPVAWDEIRGPDRLPRHDAVCYGTLAARAPTSRAAMRRLLDESRAPHKVLDVNLRPPDVTRDVLAMTLAAATAVKVAESELDPVATHLGIEARPEALFETAHALGWLCVTRGERGASLYDRSGGRWDAPAEPVDAVNAVGAGDAFTAGLTRGLVEEMAPAEMLALAQRTAASILVKPGGLPEPRSEDD